MRSRSQLHAEQRKLLRLIPEVRWRLRHIAGVRHVGVGAKEIAGEITDEFSFRVYVERKLPLDDLVADQVIPKLIKHIPTDVLTATESKVLSDRSKERPLIGGVQIRNEHVRGGGQHPHLVGTIGCLAQLDDASQAPVGLSCEHVVMSGQASLNVLVGQPKYSVSCCCCVHGQIGAVVNSRNNGTVDCAIVKLDEDIRDEVVGGGTLNKIKDIPDITGVAEARCFEPVSKRGRTTEVTTGEVIDVLYEGSQILVHPTGASALFADMGDSGSVIVNNDNKVIGLLWATDAATRTKGVANHIGEVMREMNIKIAGQSHTGLTLPSTGCSSSSGP